MITEIVTISNLTRTLPKSNQVIMYKIHSYVNLIQELKYLAFHPFEGLASEVASKIISTHRKRCEQFSRAKQTIYHVKCPSAR